MVNKKINLKTVFFLFLLVFFIYGITGPKKKTHLDYFVPLADSFLKGRLYLTENPPWLNELVPIESKYYVVYPPMPAILLMPLVAIFGIGFSQTLFSQIIGSLNAVLAYVLFLRLKCRKQEAILLSLLLTLGTNHWYLASIGSAWYLALVIGVFFSFLSLIEFFGRRRYFWVGFLIGCAYWCRLPTILALFFPTFFIVLGKEKQRIKSLIQLFSGVGIFLCLNFIYNYFRFGTIFDVAYIKIPGILKESDFQYGLFSFRNIARQLKVIFFKMPIAKKSFPFIMPSWYGMAIWLTTPAFFLVLKADYKKKLALFSLLTVFIMSIPTLTHSTVGFTQFGYRYAMDFTPFLLILTALGCKRTSKKLVYFLSAISFMINLWGVLWINKFNWVGW